MSKKKLFGIFPVSPMVYLHYLLDVVAILLFLAVWTKNYTIDLILLISLFAFLVVIDLLIHKWLGID